MGCGSVRVCRVNVEPLGVSFSLSISGSYLGSKGPAFTLC